MQITIWCKERPAPLHFATFKKFIFILLSFSWIVTSTSFKGTVARDIELGFLKMNCKHLGFTRCDSFDIGFVFAGTYPGTGNCLKAWTT